MIGQLVMEFVKHHKYRHVYNMKIILIKENRNVYYVYQVIFSKMEYVKKQKQRIVLNQIPETNVKSVRTIIYYRTLLIKTFVLPKSKILNALASNLSSHHILYVISVTLVIFYNTTKRTFVYPLIIIDFAWNIVYKSILLYVLDVIKAIN